MNFTQPYPPSGAWYVSTTVFAGVDIDESDDDPDIMEEASAPKNEIWMIVHDWTY